MTGYSNTVNGKARSHSLKKIEGHLLTLGIL